VRGHSVPDAKSAHVTGTQVSSNSRQFTSPAQAGKTYNLPNSPVVTAQYQFAQSLMCPGDGPM